MTLNNLTDEQITHIMEQRDKHTGKFSFPFESIRQVQAGPGTLNDNVQFVWNNNEGFAIVLDISHALLGDASATVKTA